MKHAILSIISLLFLATNLFAAAWTGATSEPENMKKIDGKPFYVITNADELAWFAAKVNAGETAINAVFANDIVFGKDTSSFSSVARTTINAFDGILDGNEYTIYGIFLDRNHFINKLKDNGYIKNIKIKNFKLQDITYTDGCHGVGFVSENYGTILRAVNYNNNIAIFSGGIANINYGKISYSVNYGKILAGDAGDLNDPIAAGGISAINKGLIEFCINYGSVQLETRNYPKAPTGGLVAVNEENGTVIKSKNYSDNVLINQNKGKLLYNIQNSEANIIESNSGTVKTYHPIKHYYYINNTKIESTAEKMQTDQFAWVLNTENGTEENIGIWSRGSDGYPTWANDDSLAIFKVAFNDDGIITNRYTNYKGLVTFPEDPEPAEGYIFTGWYNADGIKVKPTTVFTADQTVNAVYMDASDVYWTINFYNAAPADTLLEGKSYQHGSIVTYGGADPTLTATAKYTYTFKGWDVEPTNAVEDFNYHAIYDSTIRSYTITFNNSDGSKIESATFEYGKMPSCSKTPTRDATVEWKYTHKGWKPALDYVTEEATYTAIYDSVKVEYKVTFMNGTEIIDEQMVPYGGAAVAPTGVTREGYKFVGWNTSFAKVTTTLTVKALFEELIVRSVNVVNADGEKIDNQKTEAPKKEGYTFDAYYDGSKKLGVAGDEITITASITITAKYIKNPESSSSSKEIASSSSQNSVKSSSSTKVVSSSSSAKSSSSSKQPKSSSSGKKTEAIITNTVPQFSVHVEARNLQISGAKIGATYALFDMQGKVLLQGHTYATNFDLNIARPGNYLLKIGASTQKIRVK